ncbi:MAG TPA: hypothetical protein VI432_00530 [Candidatus Paceibacterota bacterium]
MLLVLHIIGGVLIGLLIILSFLCILFGKNRYYIWLAGAIGIGGGVQLVTGSLLTMISSGSLLMFCARISLYLVTIIVAEGVLWIAMSKDKLIFPPKLVFAPIIGSLAFAVFGGVITFYS